MCKYAGSNRGDVTCIVEFLLATLAACGCAVVFAAGAGAALAVGDTLGRVGELGIVGWVDEGAGVSR